MKSFFLLWLCMLPLTGDCADDSGSFDAEIANGLVCRFIILDSEGMTASVSQCLSDNITDLAFDELVLPAKVNGYYIVAIGDNLFSNIKLNVKSLVIENGIQEIGRHAFRTTHIEKLSLPPSISFIRAGAFLNTGMRRVEISDMDSWCRMKLEHPNSSPTYANPGCTVLLNGESVSQVIVPDGVKEISPAAFYDFHDLESVVFPQGLKSIKAFAFWGCDKLKSLVFPESLTSIQNSAFVNCSQLTNVTFPQDMDSIGAYSFSSTNMQVLRLPEGMNVIDKGAFEQIKCLRELHLPKYINKIEKFAFTFCSNLQYIYSPSMNPITISKTVFGEWEENEDDEGDDGDWGDIGDFSVVYPDAYLHIPKGSKEKYETTESWCNFQNIIEEDGTTGIRRMESMEPTQNNEYDVLGRITGGKHYTRSIILQHSYKYLSK